MTERPKDLYVDNQAKAFHEWLDNQLRDADYLDASLTLKKFIDICANRLEEAAFNEGQGCGANSAQG